HHPITIRLNLPTNQRPSSSRESKHHQNSSRRSDDFGFRRRLRGRDHPVQSDQWLRDSKADKQGTARLLSSSDERRTCNPGLPSSACLSPSLNIERQTWFRLTA